MSGAHDSLVKETFSNVQHAIVELRSVLPPKVVEQIDFNTLELCPGSFVDQALSHLHTDLLYRVRLAGREAYVYLLFEHQSTVDKFMLVRFLRSELRVLDKLIRDGASLPLPVVLPLLLHHSEHGWTAATSMHELFDPEVLAIEGMAELVPQFRMLLDDISHKSDEELMGRALDQTEQVVPVVLWALRDARNAERLLTSLRVWAGAIEQVLRAPNGRAALLAVFSYISRVTDSLSVDDVLEAAEHTVPEAREVIMTLAEQWKKEGEAEGLKKGEREVLRKQLVLKFGELSEATRARLAQATEHELDLWAKRVLSATSLDEVLS